MVRFAAMEWIPPNQEYPPPKPGEPPLHAAARVGDVNALRRLVEAGEDINAQFDKALESGARRQPATPLMVAAGSGDGATIETVRALLELGADPTVKTDGGSAAIFACTGLGWNYAPGGDVERLQVLLEAGSPLPSSARGANRLLCETARSGDAARLRVLLDRGLDPKGFFDPEEAKEQHRRMTEYTFANRDLWPSAFMKMPDDIRQAIEESMRESEQEDGERMSSAPWSHEIPLFRAAESGCAECVRLLLDAGADPLMRDNSQRTAMYHVSSVAAARTLMQAGVPINDADEFGWSPLRYALGDGEDTLQRVRTLIEAGADVNATSDSGYTVFMSAAGSENRSRALLRTLVEAGADPHAVSEYGYNAFHAAIDVMGEANSEGSVRETFEYLAELGVDIEQRNSEGHTPLARAMQEGYARDVKALCDLGADPNAVSSHRTCGGDECRQADVPLLFHAIDGIGLEKGLKAEALLQAGADPIVTDAEGYSPLVRAIASLCARAPDYLAACNGMYKGLAAISSGSAPGTATRDGFLQTMLPAVRSFLETFTADFQVDQADEYDVGRRDTQVAIVALLAAYEAWYRRSGSASER